MKGHIRRRGQRSWAIVIDVGRDVTGRRKQRWHTVTGTKRDAERELARVVNSLNTGEYVEPSRLTVREYLNYWLAHYAKPNTSGKTYERYAQIVTSNLVPGIGHHKLSNLQPLHIQQFYSDALASGRRNGKGGLSAQTVLHFHRVLSAALAQAVRWLLLARNPANAVQAPHPRRREMRVLSEVETARLLKAAERSRLKTPLLLAVTTGMRRGEIAALGWREVDLKAGILTVARSLEQTMEGLTFKTPKTAKGRRVIALPSMAVEALRQHRAQQGQHRLELGPLYDDHGLVCPRPDGRPWSPDAISSAFQDLIRRSRLPRIGFHDLRHGHATQLLRQGEHPKIVSERLGHATVEITLDTYSHVVPGLQEQAARRLDHALRHAMRKAEKEHSG
jgi:integrase